MKKVRLGNTGIEVSRLGYGTGSAHQSGGCVQTRMTPRELGELLLFAYDLGVNFWDTAVCYGTHPHIKEGLKYVQRSDIVITTKITSAQEKEAIEALHTSLNELGVDHIDVCLLHGVRTRSELAKKRGAFDALLRMKEQGKVRSVGISSHGVSALRAAAEDDEIDVVWARINYAGLCMDSSKLDLYDSLVSIPWLKSTVKALIPRKVRTVIHPGAFDGPVSRKDRVSVDELLKLMHARGKGIAGMKVLAEGVLRSDVKKAISYVKGLSFVDSFFIGMMSKKEIEENCREVNG